MSLVVDKTLRQRVFLLHKNTFSSSDPMTRPWSALRKTLSAHSTRGASVAGYLSFTGESTPVLLTVKYEFCWARGRTIAQRLFVLIADKISYPINDKSSGLRSDRTPRSETSEQSNQYFLCFDLSERSIDACRTKWHGSEPVWAFFSYIVPDRQSSLSSSSSSSLSRQWYC